MADSKLDLNELDRLSESGRTQPASRMDEVAADTRRAAKKATARKTAKDTFVFAARIDRPLEEVIEQMAMRERIPTAEIKKLIIYAGMWALANGQYPFDVEFDGSYRAKRPNLSELRVK